MYRVPAFLLDEQRSRAVSLVERTTSMPWRYRVPAFLLNTGAVVSRCMIGLVDSINTVLCADAIVAKGLALLDKLYFWYNCK
jgi:hypothetical protein